MSAETEAETERVKARVRETFGRAAEAYVASPGHAGGDDLQRLVELAEPNAANHALDVSTGGGHVALALAPYVASVTASDLTPRMLDAA
ncbi:MAG: class I SAM-dependent methyltransferase, partial [Ktedonobacterales bacterium]